MARKCPLRGIECTDQCAWYHPSMYGDCAVVHIAVSLRFIQQGRPGG